jgi:hypothetical protein
MTNEGRKEGRIPTTDKRTKKGSTNQPTNQPTKKGNDRQANEEGQQTCANLEGGRRGIKSLERHNKFDEASNPFNNTINFKASSRPYLPTHLPTYLPTNQGPPLLPHKEPLN